MSLWPPLFALRAEAAHSLLPFRATIPSPIQVSFSGLVTGGCNGTRTSAENCIGRRRSAVLCPCLSSIDVLLQRTRDHYDHESLRPTRNFSAVGSARPKPTPQFDCLCRMGECCSCQRNGRAGILARNRSARVSGSSSFWSDRHYADRTHSREAVAWTSLRGRRGLISSRTECLDLNCILPNGASGNFILVLQGNAVRIRS